LCVSGTEIYKSTEVIGVGAYPDEAINIMKIGCCNVGNLNKYTALMCLLIALPSLGLSDPSPRANKSASAAQLKSELVSYVQKYYAAVIVKCGDNYYITNGYASDAEPQSHPIGLIEIKGGLLKINIKQGNPITDKAMNTPLVKMNGHRTSGEVHLYGGKYMRFYSYSDSAWGDWQDISYGYKEQQINTAKYNDHSILWSDRDSPFQPLGSEIYEAQGPTVIFYSYDKGVWSFVGGNIDSGVDTEPPTTFEFLLRVEKEIAPQCDDIPQDNP